MSVINNVALVGATGNLGPSILKQLLNAGFQVTVLTREGSTHEFPPSVVVKHVNYDSLDSLTAAFQGQDAVISTLGFGGFSAQQRLVEAALKAHVKRFVPSEFGSDTKNSKTAGLAVFADKVALQKFLENEAAKGNISYTYIYNGPFLDWGIKVGLIINPKEKAVTLYDGGERLFSTTTLDTIGKAVAAALKKPEETRNRGLFIQDAALTLKQLKAIAEKVTGVAWQGKEVSVENEVLAPALAELQKENPDPSKTAVPLIITSIWGEGYGSPFPKLDNELLGLRELTEAEIEGVVAAATK
ncbi:hypothetical protein F5Y08DRAFT_195927 [Xylaria arbuscula]|uniref:NmrA-like domain-containing protein n=1 Tax=Xylaria arbuscula TaxID=114810 RepID=A0A9W8TMY7_9PEZI|nr:hypothetical protein F5Y08DRAFT_195927 [Xylaria arbuscula]KAJ3576395.1 hypothetical protein NPX13_g3716 [Xylaria arbuscula]